MFQRLLTKSGIGAVLVATLFLAMVAMADVPTEMNVQGRLTDDTGAPLAAGPKDFYFKIFDDEFAGVELWPMTALGELQTIQTDDNGLWSARVGSFLPIPASVFDAAECWLQITVYDGTHAPETMPRVKLNTSPYSFNVSTVDGAQGGEITGKVSVQEVQLGSSSQDGTAEVYQSGSILPIVEIGNLAHLGGQVRLYDENNNTMAQLEADGNGEGAYFRVHGNAALTGGFKVDGNYGGTGSPRVFVEGSGSSSYFRTDQSGDGSVILPNDAISQDEILDEPGIASSNTGAFTPLGTSMTDIETVTLTIPTDGYILLTGQCWLRLAGTTGNNGADIQIDETAGGSYVTPYFAFVSKPAFPTTGSYYHSVFVQRVYYKTQGEYTFRLEGMESSTATGSASADDAILTAVFYPKSYGSVVTAVAGAEAAQFDNAVALPARTGKGELGSSEQLYEVDLRELELKAARLRAELRQVERERDAALNAQQEAVKR